MSERDEEQGNHPTHESVNRESHPNAGGPEGLAGDMGVSSERDGPFEGIEGTGSLASVQEHTDGEAPNVDPPQESLDSSVDLDKPDETSPVSGVDRTVGEVQPDPVANKHQFDPSRNPRH
jgi:hypothetical protein